MNIFFGKVSRKNKEQIEQHCYRAAKDYVGFQGLEKGDYVFMLCEGRVHLWQAGDYIEDEDGKNGKRVFDVDNREYWPEIFFSVTHKIL